MSVEDQDGQVPIKVERLNSGPEIVTGLRLARVMPDETERTLRALRARPDVLYAEPNFIRHAQTAPNDPRYPQMWGLNNTGQPSTSGGNPGMPGNDIRAEQSWAVTTGSKNVVVGIIDEGIDINHEDLSDNIWINPGEIPNNGIDDDSNGLVDDINGWDFAHNDNTVFDYTEATYPPSLNYSGDVDDHGTHVAGTIGAVGNNGKGVVGVNWQVSLMSLKFLTGPQGGGTTANAVKACAYAKTMRELWLSSGGTRGANIRVLNGSYGGGGFSQAELEAIRALGEAGILFVAAAGNQNSDNDKFPNYPSGYLARNLISVAASTGAGSKASFSNYGSGTVHMTAPGEYILSTSPKNTYKFASGTSMATPHVAGAGALLCAAFPSISLEKLRAVVLYSGNPATWAGNPYQISTGRSLSVSNAIQAVTSTDTVPPGAVGQARIYNSSFPNYGLQWAAAGDDGNTGKVAAYQVRFSETEFTDPAQFDLATPLPGPVPTDAGFVQFVTVRVPWRHASGFIGVRAIDEVGNAGPISSIPLSFGASVGDPYTVTEGAPSSLSTGGTPLGLIADDEFKNVSLPFDFQFYDLTRDNVWVSTNGSLYFSFPPTSGTAANDFASSTNLLDGYRMAAAEWDDLRTDRRPGDDVYVAQPDETRIIFRWQAVTYDTPLGPGLGRGENPVNFEIELQRSGTIIMRYGDGNQKLFPVVGLGGGWPEAYLVDSHSSHSGLMDLTNAPTVTFALRNPPPPPTSNLGFSLTNGPDPVGNGDRETYNLQVNNGGPYEATNTIVTDPLPPGLLFVSCTTSKGTCSGPSPGSNGTVTVNVGQLSTSVSVNVTIIAEVIAAPGTSVSNTMTVSSSRFDNDTSNNSKTATTQVIQASVFGGVSAISSGYDSNLILKQDGSLWTWGETYFGDRTRPLLVPAPSGITAVSAGRNHWVALKSDGTVWSWGQNSYGQAGGAGASYPAPVNSTGLTNISAVSAGSLHSMALRSDGTLWVWGATYTGHLGLGSEDSGPHPTPVQVPGLTVVTFIAAGDGYSLIVRNDGSVWSWGQNLDGQLGGTGEQRNSPAKITGVDGVKAIAVSRNHVIALKVDGTVMAWGSNSFGETGSSNPVNVNPTPTQVNNLTGVIAVAAGSGFSLALKSDGTLWGWGHNNYGLFGNGPPNNDRQPNAAQISGLINVIAVAAGDSHGLVLLSDGTLRTWGANARGQLGDGTTFNRAAPFTVTGNFVVSQPTFSGSYVGYPPISIRIDTDTAGAVIHYTLNGQDPTESDPVIASGSSITVNENLTLKARAYKSGWTPSPISTANLQILVGWQRVVLSASETDIKTWATGGRTYAYLRLSFPNAGYRVGNWGSISWSGSNCFADAIVEKFTGSSVQAVTTTAQIYDLGPLTNGNYVFTFQNSGTTVKSQAFTVSSAAPLPNPIDDARQFVKQQYRDFLNREADQAGEDFWTDNITKCSDPARRPANQTVEQCTLRQRETTSGAFFLSPESQYTGYFVYRMYQGTLGRQPKLSEFLPDAQFVGNGIIVGGQLSGAKINENKAAFAAQFVNCVDATKYRCAEFKAIYDPLTNQQFVDKLFQTTGVNASAADRAALVDGLNANPATETRASVVQKVVDGITVISEGNQQFTTTYGQAFYNSEFNRAFVQLEYFGYMKRDPDEAGYAFWLGKLNQFNGDFVAAEMVLAFISSPEYRARFGQP